ncbi:MAG: hypothetical protein NVS9B12_07530 [Vulcanimicrobiaceae bacterium]
MPEFVGLATMLGRSTGVCTRDPELVAAASLPCEHAQPPEADLAEAGRRVRLFKAHLQEVLMRELRGLLAGIAREVLARELLLAPADIGVIVEDALKGIPRSDTLRVRVHPGDVTALKGCSVPVLAEGSLRCGDAVFELKNGTINVTLQTRLEALVARSQAV